MIKKSVVIRRSRFNCWVGKIPWRREWNRLQYSCWENPMGSQIRHSWATYTTTTAIMIKEGFPRWCSGEESASQCRRHKRHGFDSWVRKIPWRRKWQPPRIFLLGKSHAQRSLGGCNPWGRKESDMLEWLSTHIIFKCILQARQSPKRLSHFLPPRLYQERYYYPSFTQKDIEDKRG